MMHVRSYIKKQNFQPGKLGIITNPFYSARNGLYKNIIKLSPYFGGRLLDVGCGQKPYHNLFAVDDYIGMEIDTPNNRHNKNVDVFYDGHTFPFLDDSFDGVLTNQVFEHVFNPSRFIEEIRRVLRPGGHLLLSAPFSWDEHEQPYDFARYSSFGMRYILENNGFTIVEQHKSVTGIKALFQLLNSYLYKITRRNIGFFHLKHIGAILFPFVTITGELSALLLPKSEDLYLDNVILARKKADA